MCQGFDKYGVRMQLHTGYTCIFMVLPLYNYLLLLFENAAIEWLVAWGVPHLLLEISSDRLWVNKWIDKYYH